MPTFDIYRDGKKIASKEFKANFYIVKGFFTREISWKADKEKGGNEILLWIQSVPRAMFVRPDWKLIIDGVSLPQDFYPMVELGGKHVIFQYSDYEFVCQFPETNS